MTVRPAASSVLARSEDIDRLQNQLDDIKSVLASVVPMLPLLTSLQDYFQQVECEATRQTAIMQSAKQLHSGGSCDTNLSEPRLALTRWIQHATTAIASVVASTRTIPIDKVSKSGWSPRMEIPLSEMATPSDPIHSLKQQKLLQIPMSSKTTPTSTATPSLVSPTSIRSLPGTFDRTPMSLASSSPLNVFGFASNGPGSDDSFKRSDSLISPTSLSDSDGPEDNVIFADASKTFQGVFGDAASKSCHQSPEQKLAMCEKEYAIRSEALITGSGAWARAYQNANGDRRRSLYLLCLSGIVTTREVSDDLTAISREHIDDCITVATEMLSSLPHDVWIRQPKEANKFFEGRFSALYKQKYG